MTQPPGASSLEVLAIDSDSYAVRAARLRQVDRAKRVLGRGAKPAARLELTLEALISERASQPKRAVELAWIPMEFRSGIGPVLLSRSMDTAPPTAVELEPVMRKLAVWSPQPVANHGCQITPARGCARALKVVRPGPLPDLSDVPPFETGQIVSGEIPNGSLRAMPPPAGTATVVSGRTGVRILKELRIIGPRLRFTLPSLD